jgi:hypothetical protein
VLITTKVVSSNLVHGEVYLIQHYSGVRNSNLITVLSIHVLGNLKKTFFMTDVRFAHPTSTSPMGENMTLRNI